MFYNILNDTDVKDVWRYPKRAFFLAVLIDCWWMGDVQMLRLWPSLVGLVNDIIRHVFDVIRTQSLSEGGHRVLSIGDLWRRSHRKIIEKSSKHTTNIDKQYFEIWWNSLEKSWSDSMKWNRTSPWFHAFDLKMCIVFEAWRWMRQVGQSSLILDSLHIIHPVPGGIFWMGTWYEIFSGGSAKSELNCARLQGIFLQLFVGLDSVVAPCMTRSTWKSITKQKALEINWVSISFRIRVSHSSLKRCLDRSSSQRIHYTRSYSAVEKHVQIIVF